MRRGGGVALRQDDKHTNQLGWAVCWAPFLSWHRRSNPLAQETERRRRTPFALALPIAILRLARKAAAKDLWGFGPRLREYH